MNKKLITIIVLLVVIIGLVAALFLLNREEPAQEESSAVEESTYVLGGDAPLVPADITVKNENGEFTLVNTNPEAEEKSSENYTVKGLEAFELSASAMSSLMDNSAILTAMSVISEDENADLGLYGLSNPRSTAAIKYSNNTTKTLLLGDESPGSEGIYAKLQNSPQVYLISSASAAPFFTELYDYPSKVVTPGVSGQSGFDYASLGGTVRQERIEISATPEEAVETGGITLNSHKITSPIEAGLSGENGLAPLLTVFGLNATRIAAIITEDTNLEAFGLAEPYSTLLIESSDVGMFLLSASQIDEEGNVYAIKEGVGLVYVLPATSLPWLESQPFDLMDHMAVLPYIDDISTVKINMAGQTTVFELSGEGDDLVVTAADSAMEDAKNFRTFYQTLISASYNEATQEEIPEDAALLLEITYSYRDGSTDDVLSFYSASSRRVFMSLNGGKAYYGLSTYVDRVVDDLAKVLAGETVVSYY